MSGECWHPAEWQWGGTARQDTVAPWGQEWGGMHPHRDRNGVSHVPVATTAGWHGQARCHLPVGTGAGHGVPMGTKAG